jgi:hypothetical protein
MPPTGPLVPSRWEPPQQRAEESVVIVDRNCRAVRSLSAVLPVLVLLAACGDDSDVAESQVTTTEPAAETTDLEREPETEPTPPSVEAPAALPTDSDARHEVLAARAAEICAAIPLDAVTSAIGVEVEEATPLPGSGGRYEHEFHSAVCGFSLPGSFADLSVSQLFPEPGETLGFEELTAMRDLAMDEVSDDAADVEGLGDLAFMASGSFDEELFVVSDGLVLWVMGSLRDEDLPRDSLVAFAEAALEALG